jgi:hypothetical protein
MTLTYSVPFDLIELYACPIGFYFCVVISSVTVTLFIHSIFVHFVLWVWAVNVCLPSQLTTNRLPLVYIHPPSHALPKLPRALGLRCRLYR